MDFQQTGTMFRHHGHTGRRAIIERITASSSHAFVLSSVLVFDTAEYVVHWLLLLLLSERSSFGGGAGGSIMLCYVYAMLFVGGDL